MPTFASRAKTWRRSRSARSRRGCPTQTLISTGGGHYPTRSRTKRELFYGTPTPNGQIIVAPYAVEGDSFRTENPRLWSEGRYQTRGPNRMFDLHPDGTRFALAPVSQTPGVKQDKVTFIFNVFDELRRIAPVTR